MPSASVLSTRQKIYLPFKRFLDLFFSLIGILILIPFMLIVGKDVIEGKQS